MRVNPGELNKKIVIGRYESFEDKDGFKTESQFVEVRNPWAKVTRLSGTEMAKANAEFSESKTRFLVRYKPGLNTDMVVKYGGKDYNIVFLNDYEERHELQEIICELKELI